VVVALVVRFGSAATFSLVLALPAAGRVTAPFVQSTKAEQTAIPFGASTVAADLYRPAHPRGAILLVHGLSPAGRRQPDLARLAELFARHGQLALVPQFEGLAAFRLDGTEVAAVVAALDHAARLASPVAIAGFSFGAGPALLAAAERPRIRLAGSFGGYADLRSVIAFVTTSAAPEPYNRWKLLQLLAGFAENPVDRSRLDAIAQVKLADPSADTTQMEAMLGADARLVLALVYNRRPDALDGLLARLSPGARAALDRLSPLPAMARLRGRVLIAHGRADISIPYTESVRLAEGARTRAVILSTFHHTGPLSPLELVRAGRVEAARAGRCPAERREPLTPLGYTVRCAREGWTVAGRGNAAGGKSGLRRAGCWVTPRGGNPTDQCHRKETAVSSSLRGWRGGKGETVR